MARKSEIVTIKWMEYTFDVLGVHYPSYMGSREQPPEPESFEIETIKLGAEDISDLIEKIPDALAEIEVLCVEELNGYRYE
jgi:hypothetical protein